MSIVSCFSGLSIRDCPSCRFSLTYIQQYLIIQHRREIGQPGLPLENCTEMGMEDKICLLHRLQGSIRSNVYDMCIQQMKRGTFKTRYPLKSTVRLSVL